MNTVKIAGLQKMTLIDYPGKVAATVFLAGCNFRCGFCHNPEIVNFTAPTGRISLQEFFNFLKSRQGLLDGICVSGGEPLINRDLPEFLQQIKALGYLVKLDTNGAEAGALKSLLEQKPCLLDFIAMDIKGSEANYPLITGRKIDFANIKQSLELIMASGLDYELRTTVLPKFHTEAEMEKIGQMIQGAKKYYLQNFRNQLTLNPDFAKEKCLTPGELEKLKKIAQKYVKYCEIRN